MVGVAGKAWVAVELHSLWSPELRAVAFVPIRHGGELIGLIGAGFLAHPHSAGLTRAARALPSLVDAADVVGALLAPYVEARRDHVAEASEVRSLIASHRFSTVFQPIVELDCLDIIGFEALTRFADGVAPDMHFGHAGRLGLGREMEASTMRAAVAASHGLPSDCWFSVNASTSFLLHGGIARILVRRAHPVVVELTEGEAIEDYAAVRRALLRLGEDVRLAVDDMGAGFASLRHIIELQPHFIKLDLGLTRGIELDPARQAIVASMNEFAGRVGCSIVAEGIETEPELATLRSLGVPLGQGFLIGRPQGVAAWAAAKAV